MTIHVEKELYAKGPQDIHLFYLYEPETKPLEDISIFGFDDSILLFEENLTYL